MSLTFDVALIAKTDLPLLIAGVDLTNLEASTELDLDQICKEATNELISKLEGQGHDVSLITNESRLRSVVAYMVVERLAEAQLVGGGTSGELVETYRAKHQRLYGDYRVQLSEGDEPRRADEGVIAVGNLTPGPVFSDQSAVSVSNQRYYDGLPEGF